MRVTAQGDFTRALWKVAFPVFQQITGSRFLVELAKGALPRECFAHYLSQDVLYLRQDNEALAYLSQNAPDESERLFFRRLAEDGIAVEQAMQNEYLAYFGIQEAKEQSPVFREYGDFLLNNVHHAPYPVALAALLPCFWLYGEAGGYLMKNQLGDNQYQKFIDTYAGETYDLITIRFVRLVEQHGQQAPESVRLLMEEAFLKSSRFEYLVFEDSYKTNEAK